MKINKELKYCLVYVDFDSENKLFYYVRIGQLETPTFPHGLGITCRCYSEEEVEVFARQIDEYLAEMIDCYKDDFTKDNNETSN